MSVHKRPYDEPIIMIEHDAFENAFNRLYEETMALIEQTATYIDTEGKYTARFLSAEISAIYAKEAMYLSTRLMQIASQLLLLRAEREGEMTSEQIQKNWARYHFIHQLCNWKVRIGKSCQKFSAALLRVLFG